MTRRRHWLLIGLVLLAAAAGLAVLWAFHSGITTDMLQTWIAGLGVWAPVGVVVLYAVATVAMVPGSIFDLAGGALFGPYLGRCSISPAEASARRWRFCGALHRARLGLR